MCPTPIRPGQVVIKSVDPAYANYERLAQGIGVVDRAVWGSRRLSGTRETASSSRGARPPQGRATGSETDRYLGNGRERNVARATQRSVGACRLACTAINRYFSTRSAT